ncbi:putative magnesium transporter NIPA3 [Glycine max]|nr:putative magnesium transporter NIPA3 [Glycine max]
MGLSRENLKGLILALVSSGFIGASFIIKKQGLRRAAAVYGVRAGVGGYYYLLEPLWWVGMITMIAGEVANFVAYAFAPAVLVTPLGALSIIVSAVLADIILKEKLHNLGILGCIMCIAGSIIIFIHAPKEQPITSVLEIWNMATQPAFLAYVGSVIVLVFILVFHFAPRCGHTNVLVFTGICSLMGSLSVMSVKALGTSLKLTFEGKNQLIYPETWFFMLVVAICVIMQMNYLNKCLVFLRKIEAVLLPDSSFELECRELILSDSKRGITFHGRTVSDKIISNGSYDFTSCMLNPPYNIQYYNMRIPMECKFKIEQTSELRTQDEYPTLNLRTKRLHNTTKVKSRYNKALDTFNTAIVSPIYYVMFTTLTILASVIMFKDWDGQSGGTIVSEICGFIVVLSGTIMLHATKDFERSSSFRGSAPSSPTLSARLFTGNGDSLLKQDEENGSPESNMCSRRQELY